MKKFLVFMLIALTLTLALTSCFGNEEESTTATTTTTQQITPEPPVCEHLYNEIVTAPTCTEQGYTTYTCDCDDSYVDDYVDALGHTESDWIVDGEATTTIEGSKHTECTVCGETIKTEVIEKLLPTTSEGLKFALNKDGQSYYVKEIGNCTDTDIIIPDTYKGLPVTSIGHQAFSYSGNSITSVIIPNSVTSIAHYAFEYCTALTSITIPNSVTSIGTGSFAGCTSLTTVILGNSMTSIGEYAFEDCTSLTSVTIPASMTSIANDAFSRCTSLISITVDPYNDYYQSIEGNLYTKDGKTLIQYAIGKESTSFTIPDFVTSIDAGAFEGCTSLTSITIPISVTSIGYGAFGNCTSLTIYCEAQSWPKGWNTLCNPSNCPVVWDYKNK